MMPYEELIARCRAMQRDSARTGVAFLSTDLDVALMFANSGLQAQDDSEMRQRNRVNARTGYDTVLRILGELKPKYVNTRERMRLEKKLAILKSKLLQLGETLR